MAEYAVMPVADYKDACDAVREKTGGTEDVKSGELGAQIRSIDTQENLTEELSAQDMLIAQIAAALDGKAAGGGSEEEWIGDGNTHVWIHLEEGRTSPMLGVCPDGTVTVDWGDGTTPNTLTGTDTTVVAWTPTHNYASTGDYIITLTVDGRMGFYGSSSSDQYSGILRHSAWGDTRNYCYQNAVQKIEVGDSVTSIGNYAFYNCYSLAKLCFNSTTPPTVSSSKAFAGIPTDCIISVPVGSLAAYTAATNYPSASTYTYVEE
jgi:hypothetical protein